MVENNITLGIFIKTLIHFLFLSVVRHKCSSFNINLNHERPCISDLVTILSSCIITLRTQCRKCYPSVFNVNASEISHLLVLNKQNQWTTAIDLNVYSINQQFRLFDCPKRGKNNLLHQSVQFPFEHNPRVPYFEILKRSLITYNTNLSPHPILHLDRTEFKFIMMNPDKSSLQCDYYLKILNIINQHLNSYFIASNNLTANMKLNTVNNLQLTEKKSIGLSDYEIQKFTVFIQKLITSDVEHNGYIHSSIRGTHNNSILFFNIRGNYRFCPQKGTHHQSNTVSILVDIKNCTYAIRCKDSECNNTFLKWNKLQ